MNILGSIILITLGIILFSMVLIFSIAIGVAVGIKMAKKTDDK